MTNHELWERYETILAERERFKAERRTQRRAVATMTETSDPTTAPPDTRILAFG